LLQERRVGLEAPGFRIEIDAQVDTPAYDVPDEAGQALDKGICRQHLGYHHLLAAEGQQLPGEDGRPFPGLLDLLEAAPARIRLFHSRKQDVAVSVYGRE